MAMAIIPRLYNIRTSLKGPMTITIYIMWLSPILILIMATSLKGSLILNIIWRW